ncbi:glycosyltransferase [Streptomyces sp. NPDC047097]|uniref:glycosyltransferase n=1 Tax=Streptomyces sp. NPDC047097 TaxID=3155260 RepID=UPI0033ED3AF5
MHSVPAPALRVLLATWGTMGDIAPYTGVAAGLSAVGHQVTVVTSARHAPRFTALGLPVRAMHLDDQEELMGRSKPVTARVRNGRDIARTASGTLLDAAAEGTDLILAHPLLHPLCAVVAEGLGTACTGLYTVGHAMVLPRLAALAPWRGHALADLGTRLLLAPMHAPALRRLCRTLGLPDRPRALLSHLTRRHRAYYGISGALLPARSPLPSPHSALGHWTPSRPPDWRPDPALRDFLDGGPPPVFFGFGSMRTLDAARLGRMIAEAAAALGVRALVQSGAARLSAASDRVLTIGECPHDWLFPRVRAAVHHAGPGTVHASLAAAVPTLPVPVALDQPYWARQVVRLGLAPGALPARRLTTAGLVRALEPLLRDDRYRGRTEAVSRAMARQDGVAALLARLAEETRRG